MAINLSHVFPQVLLFLVKVGLGGPTISHSLQLFPTVWTSKIEAYIVALGP